MWETVSSLTSLENGSMVGCQLVSKRKSSGHTGQRNGVYDKELRKDDEGRMKTPMKKPRLSDELQNLENVVEAISESEISGLVTYSIFISVSFL